MVQTNNSYIKLLATALTLKFNQTATSLSTCFTTHTPCTYMFQNQYLQMFGVKLNKYQ